MKVWNLLLLTLWLTGCASAPMIKHPELSERPPQSWGDQAIESSAKNLWWTAFGDARLDSLIGEAIGHNYNLQATAARLQSAEAQAKIAGAPLYPQISGAFSSSKRKQNFIGLPIGGGGAGAVPSSTSTSYGISLNASWEIDLWGRLGAAKASALANLQAADATLQGARLSLAAQTAKAWFAAVEAQRQVELAGATVENNRTSYEQVRDRYERGIRPSLDLRLTLSDLSSAEDRYHQREQQLDRSLRQLELILGRYPNASLELGKSLPTISEQVPVGLPADLIARRPDLIAAERRLAGSHARLVAARRSLYPRISLTASTGTSSQALGDLLNGDFSVWNVVGNLVQPILQGGRIRGNINLAKSQSQESLAIYAQSVLRAYADVELALASESFLSKREQALQSATDQALAARKLAEDRYDRGLTDLITMLSAQRAAYQSESLLLSVRRLRLDARIDLHLALGGEFDEGTEFTAEATTIQGVSIQ